MFSSSIDTDRIEAVRLATREITERLGLRYWLTVLNEERQATEMMDALADSGLLGIGLAEEHGGSGGGMSEEAMLVETLGRGGMLQGRIIVPGFVRRMVTKWGTPEQAEKVVKIALDPSKMTCFAFTEAESGSNAFAMRTRAERTETGWLVNGEKTFITDFGWASQMLLAARTGTSDSGRARISLFLVDLPHPAVTGTALNITTSQPEVQYTVHFDNLELPETALVGEEGQGVRSMFSALNPERILAAAGTVGLGHFVLDRAVEYVRERSPFGRPIGSYQGVQHPLARAYLALESARVMTQRAAAMYDAGEDAGLASNAAKFLASEAGHAAVDAAVQVCGGYAFDRDSNIMWLYETIRLRRVAPVNNEMVLNFVAEKALKLPRSY